MTMIRRSFFRSLAAPAVIIAGRTSCSRLLVSASTANHPIQSAFTRHTTTAAAFVPTVPKETSEAIRGLEPKS
eukprot:4924336-Ditylum_brightwellii.AAC.1